MKKYIVTLFIVGTISLGGGYFGTSLFVPNEVANVTENKEPIQQQKQEPVDRSKETHSIENLVKTYLISSVNRDWDTVKTLSTGNYKETLETKIIPNYKENESVEYDFNPRSLKVSLNDLTHTEAVATVDYIISKKIDEQKIPSQETLQLYLKKENERWTIFEVLNK